LRKSEIIREFPLFSDLDNATVRRLGRALKTRYANPGDRVVTRDTPARSVYFIASGAAELRAAGQSWRLGRGEMFGQFSILKKTAVRFDVHAIAPSTFLVLDEARFLRLLQRSAVLREAVSESAAKRGIEFSLPGPENADETAAKSKGGTL
jgi:CPA1 family monovalent cation:H+ antiporter